jgi:hypothetical protein
MAPGALADNCAALQANTECDTMSERSSLWRAGSDVVGLGLSFKVFPGLRLGVGGRGISASFGPRLLRGHVGGPDSSRMEAIEQMFACPSATLLFSPRS